MRTTCYIRYISTAPKLQVHRVGQSYLLIESLLLLPGCDASSSPAAALVIVSVVRCDVSLILGG